MSDTKVSLADDLYTASVHKIGRRTMASVLLLAISVPFILWGVFGVRPPVKNILDGVLQVSMFMIPVAIAEVLSFYPILGPSGMYIAFTTGNISNMKLPCVAIAQDAVGVKASTKEGDIVSTIAMAGSVIVCEIILFIGMILIVPAAGILNNPMVKPALDQVLPALFGALGAYYIIKDWKISVVPLVLGFLFNSVIEVPSAAAIPLCILFSCLAARFLYVKGFIKAK